ncbi:MAG TPA: hypothetical protein VNK46_01780 [Nitrospiraceae bacterium]|jgi:hypothetical protein|nr:hypothetical protein [Nitrospiraceae bacterium]
MRLRVHRFVAWGIPVTAAIMVMGLPFKSVSAVEQASIEAPPIKVEVEIRETEKGFNPEKGNTPAIYTTTGVPTTIVVRNKDHVTHGFTSRLFKEVPVRMEGQGTELRGKDFKSFHLEPGKTMTLHFTASSKEHPMTGQPETQWYLFWCDLHPEAKGELYIVESRGEIGGG